MTATTTSTVHPLSREAMIELLRKELLRCAEGRSICAVAAEKGLFCGGFNRFTDRQLRQRLAWIARRRPEASRADLESFADRWQLARQEVAGVSTACDVQSREHDLCNGWNDFSDRELAAFCRELEGWEPAPLPPIPRRPPIG